MVARVYSASLQGIDALSVEVEVATRGSEKPRTIIVGLPDTAVRESSERVTSALQSSAFGLLDGTVVVNLAPADLRKEGPAFDLPMAVGMIVCLEEFSPPALETSMLIGELSLDGSLRPIKGVLSVAVEAKRLGKRQLLLPAQNAEEASRISGIDIIPISSLQGAWQHLTGKTLTPPVNRSKTMVEQTFEIDFSEVKGQAHVKRAIEIAAAGNHNLLLSGPPGTGKSMLAQRIPTILPELSEQEAIETTKIHSVAGKLDSQNSFLTQRPFRSPHHTISDVGLLGGGAIVSPGEISLAHHGVLFLDEFPEFRRTTLEVLRQPLEDRKVSIARASGSFTFPSSFILVAAMNPCPCGYLGDKKRPCKCSTRQIEQYRNRISGPLLDRIDLQVDVPLIEYSELSSNKTEETSAVIRQRVKHARELQQQRFSHHQHPVTNAVMQPKDVQQFCALSADSHRFLESTMKTLNFSARAHNRILKVARTIADLAGEENVQIAHLMETINLRSLERQMAAN